MKRKSIYINSKAIFNGFIGILFFLPLFSFSANAQLVVTTAQPASVLAAKIAGPGATTFGATMTCPGVANGTFTYTGPVLAMTSGVILTNGHASACAGAEPPLTSFNLGTAGDPAVAALLPPGTNTFDACILEFNVVATSDTLSFNYQFGSEEYRTAVCSIFNDAFAFFISGPGITGTPNMALVPGTNIPVEINSVNNGIPGTSGGATLSNCTSLGAGSPFTAYYIDNTAGSLLTYRGYTVKFKAFHTVIPCDTYHLKLSIVDAGNALYDSGVFIEAASLDVTNYTFDHVDSFGRTINGIPHSIVKGCSPTTVKVMASHAHPASTTLGLSFGGTAINGVDVSTVATTVTIPADSTSAIINIAGIQTPPGGTKTFTIYIHALCGGIADSITVNVMDTPTARILTLDTTICTGASVNIRTTGTAGLSYSWTPTTGLSSSVIANPTATPTATTTYSMSATLPNSGCPAIVKAVTVSVINTAISMITHDTSICLGSLVNLSVAGSATSNYSWTPTTGLSSSVIQNPVATPAITTSYTVTATGPGGICPSTAHVTITVNSINANILTPDTTECGASFLIRVAATPGLTYSWSPGTGLSSTTVMEPTASPTATTTYTMTASLPGSGCPPIVRTITVIILNTNISMVTHDTSICLGSSVNLVVSGSASNTYSWTPTTGLSNPAIQNPVATPTSTTTYTVTATRAGGLCPSTAVVTITVNHIDAFILTPDTTICGTGFKIRVLGTTGLTYNWSPAIGLSSATVMEPIATPTVTTTYTLTASLPSSGCPPVVKTITITVVNNILNIITPDTSICKGDSINIIAGGSPSYLYNWLPGTGLSAYNIKDPIAFPSATTTYTVTAVIPGAACPAVGHITITIINSHAKIITSDTAICRGDSASILVDTSVACYYHWSPSTGLSNPNIADPLIMPPGFTTYTLTTWTRNGNCRATDVVSISVAGSGNIEMIPNDSTICVGVDVFLKASGDIGSKGIIWYFGDGDSLHNVNPVIHSFEGAGIYTVSVTSLLNGCPDTVSDKIITVLPHPLINLGRDTTICPGSEPIKLIDSHNPFNNHTTWKWSTGSTSSRINVSTPGVYFVTVTVDGCESTDTVIVLNDCYINIPNVFTPNGDGINDYFLPRQILSKGLTYFKMDIFNRWGELIFETTNTDGRGWDGNYNGVLQPAGVYIYLIEAYFKDGQKEHHQGNITLIR